MTGKPEVTLPIPVQRALRKLGADTRDARRRRRILTQALDRVRHLVALLLAPEGL